MLILRGIGKAFGSSGNSSHMVRALEDVSLGVKEGEFVSIIGPSGCGKSTPLGIAAGLISGYEGEISVSGEKVHGPHPAIGIIFGGLRIGMGAAVTGALLAETKLAQAGLGYLAISYYGQFRIAEMYSVFLVIFLIAAAINWGMNVVLGRLTPHRRASYDHALFF